MTLLIFAGLLYLVGISVVLILRPELMFAKDGKWKEFGLGRNKDRYTWLPFWLFAIIWSIISYIIVLVLSNVTSSSRHENVIEVNEEIIEPENVSINKPMVMNTLLKKRPTSMEEMKSGYYILDVPATMKKGIPKYIYLGPEAPNLIYHNTTGESD